jgi:hypothetical protein
MPNSVSVTYGATCAGRLTTLQWLLGEKQCPLANDSSAFAATRGHINILMYLHKIKFPFAPITSVRAALSGHLHVLRLLYANRYAWHVDTCEIAVQSGHLAVLQWLYDHECPPQDAARLKVHAASAGRVDIMEWLSAMVMSYRLF